MNYLEKISWNGNARVDITLAGWTRVFLCLKYTQEGGEKMKKLLCLTAILVLGLATLAFAGTKEMSDRELDSVSAGDWVVVPEGSVVEEVWYNNNDIKLKDESQQKINGMSNANVVDTAVAVQLNVVNKAGDGSASSSNTAELANYNPSEEDITESSFTGTLNIASETSDIDTFSKSKEFNYESGSKYQYDETDNSWKTLNIDGAIATASESDDKNGDSESLTVGTLLVDADDVKDYDKHIIAECNKSVGAAEEIEASDTDTRNFTFEASIEGTSKSTKRINYSENNHIALEDSSQTEIVAMTNLNAVGSATAIQANVIDNIGAAQITNCNTATVVNGL